MGGMKRPARYQVYPKGGRLNADFVAGERVPLIDPETPVSSMGSCFASEIKRWLRERGYNYLQPATHPQLRRGTAAWGPVIYNTFSMRQEFRRALRIFTPVEHAWEADGRLMDPHRKGVTWADEADRRAELSAYEAGLRTAMETAEVFILTLGMTELWENKADGSVYFQAPPAGAYNPDHHRFRRTTLAENIRALESCLDLIRRVNTACKLIVTVSPVPLRATFSDENVVTANARSKATLLVAAREFAARYPGAVHYFPSYELVTTVLPRPYKEDNRHVRPETVAAIMDVFSRMFLK